MRRTRSTVLAACAVLALGAGVAAQQTVQDRTTFVTFSAPVSIPGRTLPAGTYTFRLADTQADRHIVQILDKAKGTVIATMLAVPAERREQSGEPVVTFNEAPANRAPAVRYWYYAGERAGNEFVYPKYQAMQTAQASGEPVMAIDSASSDVNDWKSGSVSRVNGNDAAASTSASTTSRQPTPPATTTTSDTTSARTTAPPATAPRSTTPQTAPATTADTSRNSSAASSDRREQAGTSGRAASRTLPKTASELPLVGLIGLLALGGAVTVRAVRVM
jgi:hypothetical protein